ncbi:hypothetical protein BGZ65_004528, partial [Modicella reniformis]
QDIVARMNRTRQTLIAHIQLATPPGIMGIDAILRAQKDKDEEKVGPAMELKEESIESEDNGLYTSRPNIGLVVKDGNDGRSEAKSLCTTAVTGYLPPPSLVRHVIPGTQATPIDMFRYIQHVIDQTSDEMALKESILEALEAIEELKDSGDVDLPLLLDQQLTNMALLWELEPYTETAPERHEVEGPLSVVSWQMESVK